MDELLDLLVLTPRRHRRWLAIGAAGVTQLQLDLADCFAAALLPPGASADASGTAPPESTAVRDPRASRCHVTTVPVGCGRVRSCPSGS